MAGKHRPSGALDSLTIHVVELDMPHYLSAEQAAEELGVTKNTLYAYVSRGLVRSEPADSSRRTRQYRAEDIRRLKRRKERRQDPETAARTALDWGLPVMESALTLIEDGRLYYRGVDACELARTRTFEEVAALLWDLETDAIDLHSVDPIPMDSRPPGKDEDSSLERLQRLIPCIKMCDPRSYDRSKQGVTRIGLHLMYQLLSVIQRSMQAPTGESIGERLRRAWRIDHEDVDSLLNTALILCADHGLNVTTFSVRCVASAGTSPYGAVNAGLSAVRGHRHTGNVTRIAALLREAERPDRLRSTVRERLRRNDTVPGFGHRLYPQGDPRAQLLVDELDSVAPAAEGTAFARAAQEVGSDVLERPPALDFALVALARVLDLPSNASLTLFALGRLVGWTAHMVEQYEQAEVIRPRAQYVGPRPETKTEGDGE